MHGVMSISGVVCPGSGRYHNEKSFLQKKKNGVGNFVSYKFTLLLEETISIHPAGNATTLLQLGSQSTDATPTPATPMEAAWPIRER